MKIETLKFFGTLEIETFTKGQLARKWPQLVIFDFKSRGLKNTPTEKTDYNSETSTFETGDIISHFASMNDSKTYFSNFLIWKWEAKN